MQQEQQEFGNEDQEEPFAKACLKLLNDEKTWNEFRDNSRKIAAEKYTWKDLFKRFPGDWLLAWRVT